MVVSSTCPCGESNESGIHGAEIDDRRERERANNGKKVARLSGHPSFSFLREDGGRKRGKVPTDRVAREG